MVAKYDHTTIHVIKHHVFQDGRAQIMFLYLIEFNVGVLDDLEHIMIVVAGDESSALHRVAHFPRVLVQHVFHAPVK